MIATNHIATFHFVISLQDLFTIGEIATPGVLDNSVNYFFPSAAGEGTLPIVNTPTVTVAQDMDHHFPVKVQMYLAVVS